MRNLLAVVLLVTPIAGCVQDRFDWYGDERFTEAERAEIQRGAEWLHAQAGLPAPSIGWGHEATPGHALPRTILRERGPSGATGECARDAVYLDPVGRPAEQMRLEHLAGLTAHEMAHCTLGFVDGYHAGDAPSDGIMRVLSPMRWTEAERAQCRERADKCPTGSEGR